MSRFDLYRGTGAIDYYLDVQADFHHHLQTRMVIPLVLARTIVNPTRGLHVRMTIKNHSYYLVTPMMGAVPKTVLGKPVGNVADQVYDITAAIDFLLQGF
jgi:toxin CcdB